MYCIMGAMPDTIRTQPSESLRFLSPSRAAELAAAFGTPLYVYDEQTLRSQASKALSFEAPYGLTVRYAMKANPIQAILGIFRDVGIHIDASSENEVIRAMRAGFAAEEIMLTSQQRPSNLAKLQERGLIYNATSLLQLETYGRQCPGSSVSIRINGGLGSGHSPGVSVAGPNSSFGIWHEYLDTALEIARKYRLEITRVHSHIGCGSDPKIWEAAALKAIGLLQRFEEADTINLGGGFKVARMSYEIETNLHSQSHQISEYLREFHSRTGRNIKLEIEPGTFLAANAGSLLATVEDVVDTGAEGHVFMKLNTGMNDFARPVLHGSQHPIFILNGQTELRDYVVVGHNCESSDLFSPLPNQAAIPSTRRLPVAKPGDLVAIDGTGAYGSAMRLQGYNSFTSPNEVLLQPSGEAALVNRGLNVDDFLASEVSTLVKT